MNNNRRLTFISIYVALALVLDFIKSYIPFLNMPSGGSINIALIPIVLVSFNLGVKDGMLAGFLWWLVSSILGLNPYYINLLQYIVDYILPSIVVGLASLVYKKHNIYEIEIGLILMMTIRTSLLVISGAIFWPNGVASNSLASWIGSLTYNLPYSIATLAMLMFIVPVLIKTLKKFVL